MSWLRWSNDPAHRVRPPSETRDHDRPQPIRDLVASAARALRARPLHLVVYAGVAGLLCGPRALWAAGLLVLLGVGVVVAAGSISGRAGTRLGGRGDRGGGRGPGGASGAGGGLGVARLGLVVALAVAVGAGVGVARTAALDRTALGPQLGRGVAATVIVVEAPRRSRYGGWSALVRLQGEPVLLRVGRAPPGRPPGVGHLLAVRGGLKPPGPYAAAREAHAELRAFAVTEVGRRGGLAGALDGVRTRAEAALDRGLPPAAAGLLRGMVLGQDDALPETTREEFRAAGLSHLVAASGTNIVLLAALALALGTALGLGRVGRLWLVLGLIVLYVPLAGGGASIQRAGIMGAAAVAAGLVGRPSSRWYALGLAALATLTWDPRAAEQPGWQLSFVAVVALLVLAPGWRDGLVRRGVPRALAEVAAMTTAATVATAPVSAAHFGQASLAAIPANLLAAPVVAPVMWLGVIAAAVGQAIPVPGPIGAAAGAVADGLDGLTGFPLGYLIWVAKTAAGVPGAVVATGVLPVGLVAGAATLAALAPRTRRGLGALAVLGSVTWFVVLRDHRAPPGPPAGFRLTFLDVGQGDATLIQAGRRSVLVDAGLPDAGIQRLLRRAGVDRLDLFVVTHASADHEGGASAVVDGVPVGAILDGLDGASTTGGRALAAAASAHGVRRIHAQAGQELRFGRLRLRVLWPPPRSGALVAGSDPNLRAVVLEAEANGARALLTADAESEVLAPLALRPVDVLKVPHHGSADPGLGRLLERLRPRVAGIEVGAGNSYGHPRRSTLAALAGVPVVVRTDRDGSVRLDLRPDGRWEIRAHV